MIARLETERLISRQWRPADREPFARMNADPAVMEFSRRVYREQKAIKVWIYRETLSGAQVRAVRR
jgi:RimJ/RimL family protein N-acetyltransferase